MWLALYPHTRSQLNSEGRLFVHLSSSSCTSSSTVSCPPLLSLLLRESKYCFYVCRCFSSTYGRWNHDFFFRAEEIEEETE